MKQFRKKTEQTYFKFSSSVKQKRHLSFFIIILFIIEKQISERGKSNLLHLPIVKPEVAKKSFFYNGYAVAI